MQMAGRLNSIRKSDGRIIQWAGDQPLTPTQTLPAG